MNSLKTEITWETYKDRFEKDRFFAWIEENMHEMDWDRFHQWAQTQDFYEKFLDELSDEWAHDD